jgi:hypothetical protein
MLVQTCKLITQVLTDSNADPPVFNHTAEALHASATAKPQQARTAVT